jgi:dolichyl-phosphate-mannose-protein mannosyltransferase
VPVVGLLSVLICAAFTTVASVTVLAQSFVHDLPDETPFLIKLAIKAVLFAILTAGAGWGLWRLTPRKPLDPPGSPLRDPMTKATLIGLVVVMLFAAALALPNLTRYPKAEPDETYHLVFARNLAVHGVYGAGHPDTGFIPFDSYASVGPPVLGPIAAVFRLAGVSLMPARLLMAMSLLILCLASFLLLRPVFGAPSAIAGVLFLMASFGSVYLGRSLYGEVPALLYFVAGLLLWRKALARERFCAFGVLAGAAFALAVLSKMFLVVSSCAFLGVYIYDRMTYKRIRLVHIFGPGLGFIVLYGCWTMVQILFAQDDTEAVLGTALMHRPLLLFGLEPVPVTSLWLLKQPVTMLTAIAAVLAVVPLIFRKKYDPPTAVLVFLVPLYTFWWLFFASGLHARYMWYACAAAGLLTGPLFWSLFRALLAKEGRVSRRILCAAMVCVVIIPPIYRTQVQLVHVYGRDEMRDDRDLAQFVHELPSETRLATTFYPVIRSLNFHCARAVQRIATYPEPDPDYDVIIIDSVSQAAIIKGITPTHTFGRYAVIEVHP